jgi:putative transposase
VYFVRKLKLGISEQLQLLSRAAGELYSQVLVQFWRVVRKKGLWLKSSSFMRWFPNDPEGRLHAHSADAVVQSFFASLKAWRKRHKTDPNAHPPRRRRYYYRVQWKSSAIKVEDGKLRLSNGKGNEPLVIPWAWETPVMVEIGWDGRQYELRATYEVGNTSPKEESPKEEGKEGNEEEKREGGVAGVDLGEVHLAATHDGERTYLVNGRLLRSKRRYQNKLKAKLARLLARKKRGSRRYKQLTRSKQKQLTKLNKQIQDILHKQTTRLVSTLQARGVQTVVIGDIRDIRMSADYGKKANQKIHQMLHGQTRHQITYKAERMGMKVVLQDERYSSQTCPACGKRNKPKGRVYWCRCGFHSHRDAVGAYNLRRTYLGLGPVVGVMASPIGLRFKPHALCSSARGGKSAG